MCCGVYFSLIMENLTKQQIVLLTLLVSFVTSIATGIVTVSLMDQAPKSMTQTINRVVERTVEKVVPVASNASVATTNTKETVVVKVDDMVTSAVEKNKSKLLRIIRIRNEYGVEKEKFGGLAVAVTKKGLIVADSAILSKELDVFGSVIPEIYILIGEDGKRHQVVPVGTDATNSVAFFEVRDSEGRPDASVILNPVILADSDSLKLGQTVIAIGGGEEDSVSTGIISTLVQKIDKNFAGAYSTVKTNIIFNDAVSGTILLNLSGEVVGMMINKYSNRSSYLPSKIISTGAEKTESSIRSNITL